MTAVTPVNTEQGTFSYLKNVRSENEQKFLAYLMRHPLEAMEFEEENFLHEVSRAIFYGIKEIADRGMVFDIDSCHTLSVEKMPYIKWELIDEVFKKFEDFTNIAFVKAEIQKDYESYLVKRKLETLYAKSIQKEGFHPGEIQTLAEDLLYSITARKQSPLYDGSELARIHKEVLLQRDTGLVKRGLGFSVFENFIDKPGAAEEITILGGMKGFGKSIFAKTIENRKLSEGVCVLSLQLEMSQASNMDRLLHLRTGVPVKDMQQKDMSQDVKSILFRGLDEIATLKNYIYSPSEYLDASLLDAEIYRAKRRFKAAGLLPEDEYIFIVLDSIDMMKGFSGGGPYDIMESIDKVFKIVRKHGVHLFALVQASENKIRGRIFKTPEDVDLVHFDETDIYGGSYYAARARAVLMINRPKKLKLDRFPELVDIYSGDPDLMHVDVVKVNEGVTGRTTFVMDGLRISPWIV